MKVRDKVLIIPEYFITKLGYYNTLTPIEKGNIVEATVKQALNKLKCKYNSISNPTIQYLYGDVMILDKHKNPIYADIKTSHSWDGIDKVGLDYKHYIKDSEEPYIPSNTNNNNGYVYHLKADSIICINPYSRKLYIVNKFQYLKEKVLELLDVKEFSSNELLENGIELSTNKNDYDKDTKIINIAFKDMNQLGAEVIQYNLDKPTKTDIIISEKQKNLNVGSIQV